jgi:hypothetical protein
MEEVFDPTLGPVKHTAAPGLGSVSQAPVQQPTQPVQAAPVVAPTPVAAALPQGAASPADPSKIPGVREASVGGLSWDEHAQQTKEILSKQPRLPIFFPLDPGERAGEAYRSMCINGYRIEVKKNTMVYVPEAFAHLAIQSMGAETAALHEHPANLAMADAEKRRALGLA